MGCRLDFSGAVRLCKGDEEVELWFHPGLLSQSGIRHGSVSVYRYHVAQILLFHQKHVGVWKASCSIIHRYHHFSN